MGQSKELFTKLSAFGARRGASFLNGDSENSKPNFGLSDLSALLGLTTGIEARVELLRNISKSLPLDPNDIFIRYRVPFGWAYASALPHQFETLKRCLDGSQRVVKSHIRWTYRPESLQIEVQEPERRQPGAGHRSQFAFDSPAAQYQRYIFTLRSTKEKHYFLEQSSIRESDQFTLAWREYGKERYLMDESDALQNTAYQELLYPGAYEGDEDDATEFDFLMGSFDHAAVFVRKGCVLDRYKAYGHGSDARTEELVDALTGLLIDPKKLDRYLDSWGYMPQPRT